LADLIGNIDGVEIAGVEEGIHGCEIDVVGVHVERLIPMKGRDSSVGGDASRTWDRAYDAVFAVGLIPDRDNFDACFGGFDAGLQLGAGLVSEAVTDADGVSCKMEWFIHAFFGSMYRHGSFEACPQQDDIDGRESRQMSR
jgi:hypothetical protein